MVVACIALIVAIGGSAYAASKINGKDIKSDSITGKQVKENTLKNVASSRKSKKAQTANTAKFATRADSVGGQRPDDLKVRWLLLNEQGGIEEQSGGFSVLRAYTTDDNVYIDAGENTQGHGLFATIAISNRLDNYAPVGVDPNFSGEVSVGRCQTIGIECAPPIAKNDDAIIVSPRNSDGTPTNQTNRKRVYVELTE